VRSGSGGALRGSRVAVVDGPGWHRAGQREPGAVRQVEPGRGGLVTGGPGHRPGDEQTEAAVKTVVAVTCSSSKTNKCVHDLYPWACREV
jgi:hypothetical protein